MEIQTWCGGLLVDLVALVREYVVAVGSWRDCTGRGKKSGSCSGKLSWLVAVMVDGCSGVNPGIEELVIAQSDVIWVDGSAAVERKKKKKSGGSVGKKGRLKKIKVVK
jgi:hypothetical protein